MTTTTIQVYCRHCQRYYVPETILIRRRTTLIEMPCGHNRRISHQALAAVEVEEEEA